MYEYAISQTISTHSDFLKIQTFPIFYDELPMHKYTRSAFELLCSFLIVLLEKHRRWGCSQKSFFGCVDEVTQHLKIYKLIVCYVIVFWEQI